MATDSGYEQLHPAAVLELFDTANAPGGTCALLTPAIRAKLRDLDAGQVLEVRVDDAAAREDIAAWSRLSGHALLAMTEAAGVLSFYLRKKST